MCKIPSYKLIEISKWAENKTVSLPTVQRGFVWKPSQIENLWDSLLRGYPIGAFVLSPRQTQVEGESKFEMLDGQQRATAICLGFGNDTFRDSQDKLKVFIDLEKPKGEDNRKYIFRVITRSHPWGYQRTDNTKTLDSVNIRKAMNLYNMEDHLDEELDNFFPYDAILPIPFHFFTDAFIKNEKGLLLNEKIRKWKHYQIIISRNNEERQNESLECNTDEIISKRINEIFLAVKNMLNNENGQKVPALYLDFEIFKNNLDNSKIQNTDYDQTDIEENNDNIQILEKSDDTTDEIENLFIRLNAGGTPLRGEELNYSVLKAHIKQEFQDKIEKCCVGIFKPSRFITIAYRLFQNQQKEESREAITMRIKPKQFQNSMNADRLVDFEEFLKNLLDNKKYDSKTLLQYIRHILEYESKDNLYGLPYLITSKISDNAPEIMFMLLYRILFLGDRFDNTKLHRRMLGVITLFIWLGKGDKQRDHAKLLSNIWPCVQFLRNEIFWSSSTIQRAMLDNILTSFPTYDKKQKGKRLISIKNYDVQHNSDIKDEFNKKTGYGSFIDKIFFNRDLILYAQRKFLDEHFKKEQYCLDDTNIPFDWDHISPNKYVYKYHGIPRIIKDWYNSNGNFRAWPYSLNRIDQDNIPARKLNPLDIKNYNPEEKKFYEEIQKKWKQYLTKIRIPNLTVRELKEKLLIWSFCDEKWANCSINDIKKDWKNLYDLILRRNLNICKVWYDELEIEELYPMKKEIFSTVIDKRKWNFNPKLDKELKKNFSVEGLNYWVSKATHINDTLIYIYITYYKNDKEILQQNNIQFGIFVEGNNTFISSIDISDKQKQKYETDRNNWVNGYFTLVSHDEDSYVELFNNFKLWLKNFPDKNIKRLEDIYIGILVKYYQTRIKNLVKK